jgi:hypothetical protein
MESPIVEGLASAKVICDSLHLGSRLVTVEVEFPRPYLAEFNTHTRFSRNSASSRAIPVWKRLLSVLEKPYVPDSFGKNKAGMQAGETLSEVDQGNAVKNWLIGRDIAVIQAFILAGGYTEFTSIAKKEQGGTMVAITKLIETLDSLIEEYGLEKRFVHQSQGMHKQHANRVLEPYAFHTVVVTATHWRNFFGLRASKMAQPEAQDFGIAIAKAIMASRPTKLSSDEWHLPYIRQEDRDETSDQVVLAQASAGKCARVSYLTHEGVRSLDKDVELATGLKSAGHMSPFQHPARPRLRSEQGLHGNYSPVWTQFRKMLRNEGDFTQLVPKEELVLGCRGDVALADFILSYPE